MSLTGSVGDILLLLLLKGSEGGLASCGGRSKSEGEGGLASCGGLSSCEPSRSSELRNSIGVSLPPRLEGKSEGEGGLSGSAGAMYRRGCIGCASSSSSSSS